jgi:hypothetical protein
MAVVTKKQAVECIADLIVRNTSRACITELLETFLGCEDEERWSDDEISLGEAFFNRLHQAAALDDPKAVIEGGGYVLGYSN